MRAKGEGRQDDMSRTDPVSPWRRRVEAEVARQAELLGGDPGEVLRALPDDLLVVVEKATHDTVPVEGVAALGRAIRAAARRDPALLPREPEYPPREALAVAEGLLAAGDAPGAERFVKRHGPAIEAAREAREVEREEAQRRQATLAAQAHDLTRQAAAAQERARVAAAQAGEVEGRLAAMGPATPGTMGEAERSRVAARVADLKNTATATKADAARLVAEAAAASAALAAHTAAAPTL